MSFIEKNPLKGWALFFARLFFDFNTLRRLFWALVVLNIFVVILLILDIDHITGGLKLGGTLHSIMGVALGLLLVFRTNTAYERWSEGRKLLGGLVNACREIAIKAFAFFPKKEDRNTVARLLAAYSYALRNHLRDEKTIDYHHLLSQHEVELLAQAQHHPNWIAKRLYQFVYQAYQTKQIDGFQFQNLDNLANQLTDISGGCERIRSTPMPQAYKMHLFHFLVLYFSTLPFVMISDLQYWTLPVISLIFYSLAGLKAIGNEIEEPFGEDSNDLPVDVICQKIEANVYEILQISLDNAELSEVTKPISDPILQLIEKGVG